MRGYEDWWHAQKWVRHRLVAGRDAPEEASDCDDADGKAVDRKHLRQPRMTIPSHIMQT